MGEALAVRSAVMTASSSNVRSLIVLSYSQVLINIFRAKESLPELFDILFDIYHFTYLLMKYPLFLFLGYVMWRPTLWLSSRYTKHLSPLECNLLESNKSSLSKTKRWAQRITNKTPTLSTYRQLPLFIEQLEQRRTWHIKKRENPSTLTSNIRRL